jgi:hypothetical protein
VHNKILINTGFYLLLLFAFSITVYPTVAYALAGAIFLIWLLDLLIFRETDINELPLFYPILSFSAVLLMGGIVSSIYGHAMPYTYLALLSFFYFIIPGFVRSGEQRRMILWTFIAGAMLVAGLHLILWWATFTNITIRLKPLLTPSLFMVTMAFSFLLSFYTESPSIREKVFLTLVAAPLALVVILSGDKAAMLFMLIVIFLLAIFRDRTIFIPFGLAVLFIFSGAFGIDYYVEQDFTPSRYKELITYPIEQIRGNPETVLMSSFYGEAALTEERPFAASHSFFLDLIRIAGPPAILLLFWVLFERAREAYFKYRRSVTQQPRAYHLIALLTVIGAIVMNFYGPAFEYPSIILASWLVWGMSQI